MNKKMDVTGTKPIFSSGEELAGAFLKMVHSENEEEIADFLRMCKLARTGDKRKICRFILQLAGSIKDFKVLTQENDDVANFCNHLTLICEHLPLRD
jgi:hypothetical protein